ncbi:MAG: SRPBCC domain-containing protein [Bacteroidia bacterium]|jgi:uncharacterized protein YndB with AHSA1/START domain|nr:START-like domain-containing protein [Paludibacter sp.]MDD3488698.1 START-like domain-containing protein [Paludibacter sp.]NCB68386.1 SRPBCC domain-containing protein [Bacteroidia bacterium]
MSKSLYTIEYLLNNVSPAVLWNSIGNPLGLSEWFADGVTVNGNEYTFSWEKYEQTAFLQQTKQNQFIRFQWEEDEGTDYYFELQIIIVPLTADVILMITDFAEESEKDDAILLWNKQIDELKRKTGM